MRRKRIATLGGLAATAIAAGLPMLPAQAQAQRSLMVPHGSTIGHAHGYPMRQDPAMTVHANPLAAGLAAKIAAARTATARYATSLSAAKASGYRIITKMIPDMGFHFMNPGIAGFDIHRPQILVYEHTGKHSWQLGALEWVFTKMPKTPPLPDATFGSFPAACHYADGTFIPDKDPKACAARAPHTGAKFTFWHPDLITMHVWAWYPNPAGLYSSMNPLVAPFNNG